MRQIKSILSFVLLLSLGLYGLHAQEAVPSSGGDATGHGGSASYTVGQVVYTTIGPVGSAVQGIQISYEVHELPMIKEAKDITLECSIYPNPVIDILTLQIKNNLLENLTYYLYDMKGKLLINKKIVSSEAIISMTYFPKAVYLLNVTDNKRVLKSFKVIKN